MSHPDCNFRTQKKENARRLAAHSPPIRRSSGTPPGGEVCSVVVGSLRRFLCAPCEGPIKSRSPLQFSTSLERTPRSVLLNLGRACSSRSSPYAFPSLSPPTAPSPSSSEPLGGRASNCITSAARACELSITSQGEGRRDIIGIVVTSSSYRHECAQRPRAAVRRARRLLLRLPRGLSATMAQNARVCCDVYMMRR